MKEYIDKKLALSHPFANGKYDHEHANMDFILGHECYKEWLETLPTADVEEVRHGMWVHNDDLVNSDIWRRWSCSECGYVRKRGWEHTSDGQKPRAKLCENCGAKMDLK